MKRFRRIIRVCGVILFIASIMFVSLKLWGSRKELSAFLGVKDAGMYFGAALSTYILATFSLALGWYLILLFLGNSKVAMLSVLDVYGRSLVSKYIPGNFFQYIQRGLLSSGLGVNGSIIAKSIIVELIIVVSVAVGIVLSGFFSVWLPVSLLLIAVVCARFIFNVQINAYPKVNFLYLGMSFVFYLLFLILAGLSFFCLMTRFGYENDVIYIVKAVLYFTLAFVGGIIVPGAPAGIGIRESIIIYIFSPSIGLSESVTVAAIMRVVTIVGDISFMLVINAMLRLGGRNELLKYRS